MPYTLVLNEHLFKQTKIKLKSERALMVPTYPPHNTVIVVLGGSNDEKGHLSQMSLDRCRQVVTLHKSHPQLNILATGGWGPHFNESRTAHGELVQKQLTQMGLSKDLFLPVALSSYTEADALEAAKVLAVEEIETILLVSSDFHMGRALHYFSRVFPDAMIVASPAKSTLPPAELQQRIDHESKRMKEIQAQSDRPHQP